MAHWIKTYKGKNYDDFHDCRCSIWSCTCSVCGWSTGNQGVNFDYCPKCGTKMDNAYCDDVIAREDVNKMMAEIDKYLLDNDFGLSYRNDIIAIGIKYCGDRKDGETL